VFKFAHGSEGDSSFLTDNNVFSVGAFFISDFFGRSAHVGVESTAETSIGTADEDQVGAWGIGLTFVHCNNGSGGGFSESSDGWKAFGGLGMNKKLMILVKIHRKKNCRSNFAFFFSFYCVKLGELDFLYLAAEIMFMVLVIFWMLVTDLIRMLSSLSLPEEFRIDLVPARVVAILEPNILQFCIKI